jgi:hypothetical protein
MLMANQDQNLNFAWQVQKLGAVAGQTGYGQNGLAPAVANVSAAEQPLSGASAAPAPTANVTEVLTNPGYASSPALISPGPVTAPAFAASTVAVQNPTGLNCSVLITGGTVTVIAVAPLVNGAAGTYTTIATSTASPVSLSVPPGGFVKITYSVVPTSWVWIATN